MSAIEILAVIGIIGYVIFCQVRGEPLRGRRAVLLPVILTVIGYLNLHGSGGAHLTGADITCLIIGTAGSAVIGLAFGAVMRLESRGGYLWAQLPKRGLWLWAALVAWRVVVLLLATGLHAHIAASAATLLLSLGVNRLAQAAVIVPRAMSMGVPFAPEKNGKVFMADTFNRGSGATGGRSDRFSHGGDDARRGFDGRGTGDRYDAGDPYDAGDRYGTGDRPRHVHRHHRDRS